ncbi:MAG: hypothetical protein WC566_11270 [Dehalococcoidia bacterium]
MTDETRINPLGWGILFFTFWGLVVTVHGLKEQPLALCVGWFSLFLSMVMLVSIIPCIRDWINRPRIKKWVLTWAFYITLMIYLITYLETIIGIDDSMRGIATFIGFPWMLVYLGKFASGVPAWIGIIFGLFFIGTGIWDYFTVPSDNWLILGILVVIGVLTIVCSFTKPKCLIDIPSF